ncbi:hypothetical protein [Actinacidiphila rubida]|uniref:Secreted protein n=1 Tax=Actinacidiphila rubida TaxID=310780 RepID=A0A1H8EX71_9ACTN|nr:hypothetical protein [Actinacidiphila rubida]SEN24093.1 hypothetical protein SAMN05216267_100320 [Actinacidiphila rubida]
MTQTQSPTRSGVPAAGGPGGPQVPRRRTAWAESAARMRASAATEPGRLRVIGAVLALLVLAFGTATAWQISERSTATGHVLHHSGPLSAEAAEIYRSLADADATVAGGFLAGGQEPRDVSRQYQDDIDNAARLITEAAANSDGSAEAIALIGKLNTWLPVYTNLVATAQADNRQGLPLGGAYLRYADQKMQGKGGLLDLADQLYRAQTGRLDADYADAKSLPWVAWVLGAAALGTLLWAQRRHYRRTNRVFNRGMLAASTACALALLWLVVGHTVARSELADSYTHGARSMQVLNDARIHVLQARSNENLTLVARGSDPGYDDDFSTGMTDLAGSDPHGVGGELAQALALADAPKGRDPVNAAIKGVQAWRDRHATERASDDNGDYASAVAQVIGGKDGSGRTVTATTAQCFHTVDASLGTAVAQEQDEFRTAAETGRNAMAMLPYGAAVLAVLAAAGAALGIGRRLAEYR